MELEVAMNKAKARQVTAQRNKKGFPLKEKPIKKTSGDKSTMEWRNVDWRKLEKRVFNLQKRIYQASSRGNVKAIRGLQKTMMRSWSAKMLAVRRVTQDGSPE